MPLLSFDRLKEYIMVLPLLYLLLPIVYACHPCPPWVYGSFYVGKYPTWDHEKIYIKIWGGHCATTEGGWWVVEIYVDRDFDGPEPHELYKVFYRATGYGFVKVSYVGGVWITTLGCSNACPEVTKSYSIYPLPARTDFSNFPPRDPKFNISYSRENVILSDCGDSSTPWGEGWFELDPAQMPFGRLYIKVSIRSCYYDEYQPCSCVGGYRRTFSGCAFAAANKDATELFKVPPMVKFEVIKQNVCVPVVRMYIGGSYPISKIYYYVTTSSTCSLNAQYNVIDVSQYNKNYLIVDVPVPECPDGSDYCKVRVCGYAVDTQGRKSPLIGSDFFIINKKYSTVDFVKFTTTSSNYWRVFEKPSNVYIYPSVLQVNTIALGKENVKVVIYDPTTNSVIGTQYLPITIRLTVPSAYDSEFPVKEYTIDTNQDTVLLNIIHSVPWVSRDQNITLTFISYDTCKIDNNNILRSTVGNNIKFDNYPGDGVLFNITPKRGVEPDWKIVLRTGLFKDWGYTNKIDVTLTIYDQWGGVLYSETKTVNLVEDDTVGVQWVWYIPRKDTRNRPIWGETLKVKVSYTAEYTPEAIRRGVSKYTYTVWDTITVKPFIIEFHPVQDELPLVKPKIVKPNQTIYVFVEAEKKFENNETVKFCAQWFYGGTKEHEHCYSIVFDTKKKLLVFWYTVPPNSWGKLYRIRVGWLDPFGQWHWSPWAKAAVEGNVNIQYLKYYMLYSSFAFPEYISYLEKLLGVPYTPNLVKEYLEEFRESIVRTEREHVSELYLKMHGLPVR